MTILRSRDNPRVQRWRRLVTERQTRRRLGRAWLEGTRLVRAYLAAHGSPVALIVSTQALDRPEIATLVGEAGVTPTVVTPALFDALADTETPQGVAAEIEIPSATSMLDDVEQCVFLERVQDPGNLGAILRSAAAFDVPTAILGGCVDPWAPKVLRAAMGAHFAMRIQETRALPALLRQFDGRRLCAVAHGGTPLHALDLGGRNAWVFGGEGRGISEATAGAATTLARIPMAESTESLNVAVAAAVCLYEAARQRRLKRQ
jgi:RNA methyltransferase, TrmH family